MSDLGADLLPGGLSVRRARRHLPRRRSPLAGAIVLLVLAVFFGVAGDGLTAAIFGGIGLLVWLGAAWPVGVRVTQESQPELWAAVTETASRHTVAMPDRVWLVHRPEVTLGRRGRELRIGLPLLATLDLYEVRALLAHELAHATFPRAPMVLAAANAWRAVAHAPIRSDAGKDPDARTAPRADDLATEAELHEFGVAVERVTDAAAVASAGSGRRAARAIVAADELAMGYEYDFLADLGLPRPRWWSLTQVGIEDLDDWWRTSLREGVAPFIWDEEEAAELAARHPGLAGPALDLTEQDLVLSLPASAIRIRPLRRRERRRLVRHALKLAPMRIVRWHTAASTPPRWWRARAVTEVQRLRPGMIAVLGREPRDHVEMVEVLVLRNGEFMRAQLAALATRFPSLASAFAMPEDLGPDQGEPTPPRQAPALLAIVEDALLPHGWRLEHPGIRGVLIGPDAARVDARPVLALEDGPAIEEIRGILGRVDSTVDGAALR